MGDYAEGVRRARMARERSKAELSESQQRKKKLVRKVARYSILITVNNFWWAQVTVWGLSLFRVSSGFWGPFFLLDVLGSVVAGAVCLGMLMTATRMTD